MVRFVERNSLARTVHIPVTCKLEKQASGASLWKRFASAFRVHAAVLEQGGERVNEPFAEH